MPTVTSSNLSKLVTAYYDRVMLERLTPNLVYQQFGIKKDLPKNEGNTVVWHRWLLFGKGRMIAESGSGTARGISAARISADLLMVGDHAKVTTFIDMVSINSVVEGAVELFADSSALTLDFITGRRLLWKRTSMSATIEVSSANGYLGNANILSAAGCASAAQFQAPLWVIDDLTTRNTTLSAMNGGNSGTALTPGILRSLRLKLRVKNCLPFENNRYKAIIHPDLVNQLRGSSAFIDLHKYTSPEIFKGGMLPGGTTERGYVGTMEGFDFYETTETPMCTVTNGATGASAHGNGRYYFTLFFGKGAYGVTNFDGGVKTFVKVPGPQDTSNPLNLYSTVGYRIISAQKVLNASACLWLASGKPTSVG